MKRQTDPETVALQFNDCINRRDLEGLLDRMTDTHTFIDSADNVLEGKEACGKSWSDFFAQWPDYRNVFRNVTADGATVIMQGRSVCADERLAVKAIWTARIEGEKVAEWRVYLDTPQNRRRLGIGAEDICN